MSTSRTTWAELTAELTSELTAERDVTAYEDEARISAFSELVFRSRTEAGLTQRELASRMGLTESAIDRIEGGGTRPTILMLERLAAALGR